MGRRSLLGGFCTLATAAAAVAGVAYLFKDEIKGTQTYKDLNEKYNVDDKIATYSAKAKDKAYEFKDKAKVAAADIKVKVDEKIQEHKEAKAAADDFEDDIIDSSERDYVVIDGDEVKEKAEDAAEAVADKAEDIKDAVADKAEDVADKAEDVAEAAADKVEDFKDAAADKFEDIKNAVEDKND